MKLSKTSLQILFGIIIVALIFLLVKNYGDNSEFGKNSQKTQAVPAKDIADDLFGEVNKTRFTAIDEPQYISGQEAQSSLIDGDLVYFFQGKDAVYVYPASILTYYHIVNDVIDEQPVAVTLCALSDTSIIYSRKVNNDVHNFGISGQLLYGNLVMYDRETGSDWAQITGESIQGKLKGQKLQTAGVMQLTNWRQIKNNPNLKVLTFPDPERRDFAIRFYQQYRLAYIGLDSLQQKKTLDLRLPAYKKGYGIRGETSTKYYPDPIIRQQGVINDQVDDENIALFFDPRYGSTKVFQSTLEGKKLAFRRVNNGIADSETKSLWNFDGQAIAGPLRGKQLQPAPFVPAYWFAWSAFYPETTYYQ